MKRLVITAAVAVAAVGGAGAGLVVAYWPSGGAAHVAQPVPIRDLGSEPGAASPDASADTGTAAEPCGNLPEGPYDFTPVTSAL